MIVWLFHHWKNVLFQDWLKEGLIVRWCCDCGCLITSVIKQWLCFMIVVMIEWFLFWLIEWLFHDAGVMADVPIVWLFHHWKNECCSDALNDSSMAAFWLKWCWLVVPWLIETMIVSLLKQPMIQPMIVSLLLGWLINAVMHQWLMFWLYDCGCLTNQAMVAFHDCCYD